MQTLWAGQTPLQPDDCAENRICAFFGHREIWCDISKSLDCAVRTAIKEYGATEFWVGGYGMFDSFAVGSIRRLKKDFPQITLHRILAYLPTRKDPLSNTYDSTIYPKGLELVPRKFAISKRNQWIADHCHMVICYIDHSYGGAYTACKAARRKNKVLINLGTFDF